MSSITNQSTKKLEGGTKKLEEGTKKLEEGTNSALPNAEFSSSSGVFESGSQSDGIWDTKCQRKMFLEVGEQGKVQGHAAEAGRG